MNDWKAVEVRNSKNVTNVVITLDQENITVFALSTLVVFIIFAPQWILGLSNYFSDGGADLVRHWQMFPRREVQSLARIGNIFIGINIIFALFGLFAYPPFLITSWKSIPPQTPVWYYVYFVLMKVLTFPCAFLCLFPIVFIIAPMFKLITEAQVIVAENTFTNVIAAICDQNVHDISAEYHAKETEKGEEEGKSAKELPEIISDIVSLQSRRFEKANNYFSKSSASILVACILWFLGSTLDHMLTLINGEALATPSQMAFMIMSTILLNSFFVGIPFVILKKCVVPGAKWERLCHSLYEPKIAWNWTKKVNGIYPVHDFVHGMELHVRHFGWKFFGVQMTIGLFRAVAGAMVTLIGVLAASIIRSVA